MDKGKIAAQCGWVSMEVGSRNSLLLTMEEAFARLDTKFFSPHALQTSLRQTCYFGLLQGYAEAQSNCESSDLLESSLCLSRPDFALVKYLPYKPFPSTGLFSSFLGSQTVGAYWVRICSWGFPHSLTRSLPLIAPFFSFRLPFLALLFSLAKYDILSSSRQAKVALKCASEEEMLRLESQAKALNLCAKSIQDA